MTSVPIGGLLVCVMAAGMVLAMLALCCLALMRSGTPGPWPLASFRSKRRGVADLLAWAALYGDGAVITKGGGLIAGYWFRGPDVASATAAERNHLTARVNAALARMGDGWVTWTECIRVEAVAYPEAARSQFPDPISQAIEDERRAHFQSAGQHYESDYALIVLYTPPPRRVSKMAEIVYDDEAVNPNEDPAPRILAQFERALADMEDYLHGTVPLKRMRSYSRDEAVAGDAGTTPVLYDELVNFLNYCLTGRPHEVRIPPVPMYMDAYLGGEELYTGDTPRYGDHFVACVTIEGFPDASRPNILAFLDSLAIPYRWSTRFIYLDQQTALKELNRYRRKWRQKQRGFFAQVFRIHTGQVNEDALLMARQADVSITDAQSAMVTFGYYTSVIVLTHADRTVLEERARLILRELRRRGFNGRIETVNTMQAWAGSLPGHAEPNIRRPVMHTLNLADLLPLSSIWAGRAANPCPFYPPNSPPVLQAATTGATPFRLNLHVGDVGHTLILGPTGSGKSTLLCTVMAQFLRYRGATVAAFDNGRSMFALCKALGGAFYDLAGEEDALALAPLQFLDTDADMAWASEWLAQCFELRAGRAPSPAQMGAIVRALTLLRESKEGRSLTDFGATCQDVEVREAIKHYTIDGPLGTLLDAKQDGLRDGRLQVFEIGELMAMGERNLLPVLLYLFRRVEKMRRGQPMLVPIDEAWVVLGHPVFREKLRDWLKTMRRSNVAIVPATQSLSDAQKSGILDVLIESCPTKIFLANEEADKRGTPDNPGPADLYRMFGLNETEIEILKLAQKKRHYYYSSPEGRRLFELALGPLTLSFVGVSDRESVARVRELIAAHGARWTQAWLSERGVNHDDAIAA